MFKKQNNSFIDSWSKAADFQKYQDVLKIQILFLYNFFFQ